VNDSISTTPVAVTAALQTLGYRDAVLLLGGMDRGLDWRGFARDILDNTPFAIITLPDNGPRIYSCLKSAGVSPEGGLHAVSDLAGAVSLAAKLAPEKGCVLLSPGAPSFPHFRDYQDRGEQFIKLSGF
jgi:UDP-N-acetylmuramoylalanine--D-glutamate ligase